MDAIAEYLARPCAAQMFGPWLVDTSWFAQALTAFMAGRFEAKAAPADGEGSYSMIDDLAVVRIVGQTQKGESSTLGGTSTVAVRRQLRQAAQDDAAKAVLMAIDSPGGTVAGTEELAAEVRRTDARKPVYAYLEDMGASAAYWTASQTRRIGANATALVGSIGTVAVVEDYSEAAAKDGVKVHVISTGEYKGAMTPGTEVTPEHLEYLQGLVDEINNHFLTAVKSGRGLPIGDVRSLADGRLYSAATAKESGLIDDVTGFEEYLAIIRRDYRAGNPESTSTRRDAATRRLRTLALSADAQRANAQTRNP